MICTGCGNTKAYKTISGAGWEYCDKCGDIPSTGISDVYWDGKEEHGLADDPTTGKPRVFGSREEKARYLKEKGLVEAGDKIRGSFPSILREQRQHQNNKDMELKALAQVRNMSPDYRRRKFMEILNNAKGR